MTQDNTHADGYYGEDSIDNDEIDLSFLDEDEDKETTKEDEREDTGQDQDKK